MTATRTQLYDWVWRIPTAQLAKLLHMSPTNVRKICKKQRIPTPPRGFWRQFETGATLEQAPLPDPEDDPPLQVQVDESALRAALQAASDSAMRGAIVLRAAYVQRSEEPPDTLGSEDGGPTHLPLVAEEPTPVLNLRQTREPAVSGIAPAASPKLSSLLSLAEMNQKLLAAETLLSTVRCVIADCDPSTRAVLTLWLDRAAEELRSASAVQLIKRGCSRIAAGAEQPDWWLDATLGHGKES